ncbi:hypothetical protein K7X08_009380 [Anisodus acutangulus]|uniref:Uncharacterized protein n=1 Tax=Anisodus acutangulus TaxID=402998 RepID=A0A9Q1RTF9_9SOLA|nr:hypothetical protein K7X08_009380 [Anisodus acutangulus]
MEIENTSDSGSIRSSRVGFSGPLVSSKRSARFNDEESYVEITLDVRDDSVLVQNIKSADQEAALLASRFEKRPNSLGSQLSFHLRYVSKEFKRMTSMNKFHNIDRSKSGALRELKIGLRVDKDADGRITQEEVKEIVSLSASANKLSKIQDHSDEYAALIMEELDPGNVGYIELYNLETLLLQAPNHSMNLSTNSRVILSQMLSQKLKPTKERNPCKRKLDYFIEDNWKRIWVIALWLSICAGLFTWKFIQYKRRAVFDVMGYSVSVAKGGAETTKFNMALVLLPVCRNTITWLRSRTKLGQIIPFDDNINFHKVYTDFRVLCCKFCLGNCIWNSSWCRPTCNFTLTCDFPRLLHATDEEYEPMKPFFGDERSNNYWWFVKGTEGWTGVVMVVLMIIAYILAQPWFRRNRLNLPSTIKKLTGFNAFWYSRHLFVIVYVLFIIHGYFLYLSKKWFKKTVAVYPGNVMAVHMSKPQGFKYTSGQYIFVNCSDVSSFQWHPFTISSAPGDDYLSMHIRTVGDWTSQLKTLFSKACEPPTGEQSGLLRADIAKADYKPRLPKLLIDGPYGAPAQDYKKYDIVLLVGLGIGATPLISIVKDVLNNIKQQKDIENGLIESGTKRSSFEWFKGVMDEVSENDQEGLIELHNYCTSVYEEGDARSALITMLQSIQQAKSGVDIVSGTRVKTHFARPNWRHAFKHVTINHPDQRIGVFYCGPQGLVGELRHLSQDFSHKTGTKFEFHKENF